MQSLLSFFKDLINLKDLNCLLYKSDNNEIFDVGNQKWI